MPATNRFVVTQTGLSTTAGFTQLFVADTDINPTSIAVSAAVNSTNVAYTVQHTLDYGTSDFISSNANWIASSGITAATTNAFTAYTFPVTAIRLYSSAGSSTGQVTMTIVQAG